MYLTEILFKEDTKFMKLNKSILLISLISIFLILSLSAVSAAGDIGDQVLSDNSASDIVIDDNEDISDFNTDIKDTNKLSQGEDTEIYTEDSTADEGPKNTSVESEDKEFEYGEDIKIPVSVKDNESNIVPIVKENLNVSNGTDALNFTLDNESNIILNKLNVGEYIIHINFLGNASYMASEKAINLNITKAATTVDATDSKAKLGSLIVDVVVKDGNNNTIPLTKDNIKFYIGEEEIGFAVKNSTITLNLTETGTYQITAKYLGDNNTNASEGSFELTVLNNNTINTVNDTFKINNHTQNVTIPITVTNTNITTTYDEETQKNVTNVNVTNKTLTKDDLKLFLKYFNGTENVTEEITDFELNGDIGNYTINFVTDKLDHSELTIIYANGTLDEANKTVTLIGYLNARVEGIAVVADFQDGSFTFQLIDADTNQPLANTTVTVRGVNFYSFTNGSSIHPFKNFTSDSEGKIVITNINMNSGYDLSSFIYNFTSLQAGKYNLTFQGTDSLDLDSKIPITVNKAKVSVVAYNYKEEVGSGVKYTFKLINANTNKVMKLVPMQFKVKINGNYTVFNATTNMSGQSSFNINLLPGTYPVTIVTNSSNVQPASASKTITVIKKQGVLTANNRNAYYGCGPTAIIKFTDKKTGKAIVNGIVKVRLYTTSKKYIDLALLTNKSGQVKFNAALSVGKHKLIISSLDTNYTASSITRYVTVKKSPAKFTAPKLTTFYRSGKIYSIKLTNTKNNMPIFGAKANIKVFISKNRYYNYTGTTDANGKINLKVSYKPGTYKVVASNFNDKGYSAKSITRQIKVTKHPIRFAPVSLKVAKGKNFQVKVISKKTKKTLSNVKVKIRVYTGNKYQTYTKKTNKKGIASLKITQSVAKHKVIIMNVATKLYSASKLTKTLTVTKK